MITPQQRIVLYQVASDRAEVLVLGEPRAVAPMFARIREALERWHGIERVDFLTPAIGLMVRQGPARAFSDPVAEALAALRIYFGPFRLPGDPEIAWSDGGKAGVVGTW